MKLACGERAGEMQPVDDIGNFKHEGKAVAGMGVVDFRRLAHAE